MLEFLTETVGYKAGLVLTTERLSDMLRDYNEALANEMLDPKGGCFRFESIELEGIVAHLLFKVGNIDDPSTIPGTIKIYHRVKNDPSKLACYLHVMECFDQFAGDTMENPPTKGAALDPRKFLRSAMDSFGKDGLDMAMEVIKSFNHDLHISPWGTIRSTNWIDTIELEELFKSEDLTTQYGSFFDQRFIDYLNANFEQISNIHWRKFEGFAGEYFDREGFSVDIGPGQNDDGIDLRIYPTASRESVPPLIIVQCKRQKQKIGKTLIKSVYADVLHEKAESGLIVTSSYLSPGADQMNTARNYRIETADRNKLRAWVEKMKVERI